MTIEAFLDSDRVKGRRYVLFDDGTKILLYYGEIRKLGLKEGQVLDELQRKEIFDEILTKRAKKRAMHLLEKCERTEKYVRDKLKDGEYPDSIIDVAIDYVKKFHYIDDERYARNYLEYHSKGKSKRALSIELKKKGVNEALINYVLEDANLDDTSEAIKKILEKKNYKSSDCDYKEKQRIFAYLYRRGFESIDIISAMNCVME